MLLRPKRFRGSAGAPSFGERFVRDKGWEQQKAGASAPALSGEGIPLGAAAWPQSEVADLRQQALPLHAVKLGDQRDELRDKIVRHQLADVIVQRAAAAVQ